MKKFLNVLTVIILLSGIAVLDGCKKKADPATVTTTAVTDVTVTTATSGGNVTSDGGAEVTARGVCWGTSTKPTITNSKTSDSKGTGSFTSSLTGLTENTLYYVRAYATNSEGTSYGNEVTFTTSQVVAATVTTTIASDVASTTAVSGGNVTADGGASITARGVCWATTANPTTTNDKTSDGTGTGTFTSNLTGLAPGTLYHIRAYATNSSGTAYGTDLTFTTVAVVPTLSTATPTNPTTTGVTSGGNITADGGSAVTARGVCWATTTGPVATGLHTSDGNGVGEFTSTVTGLTAHTTYYLRAYATNSIGTAYGNEVTFTTSEIVVPTVTTTVATNPTGTTATSGGNVTADGGASVTARGVCWATTANPTIAGSKTSDGNGTGTFTSNLTGLLPGTTYHYRAYATNSTGTAYGSDLTFTPLVVMPTVTTAAISAVTQTSASSGGNVTASGGGTVTARGVCWATTTGPVATGLHTTDGNGTGAFTSSITGLTSGETYYVRAYATNSAGTAYGNEVSFDASPVTLAVLTTAPVTSINTTTGSTGGNITSAGGGTISGRGVCWGIPANPTIAGSHTTNGTGTGSFTSSMTGLTTGTPYYVRSYATNEAGTAYGSQLAFITLLGDADGNTYNVVKIGNQIWMSENLKTTKYNDNSNIPNVTDNGSWQALNTDAYCWYANDIANKDTYGALYNWFAVDQGKLCPTGWHVASDADFNAMELSIGIPEADIDVWGWRGTDQGTQLKSTSGWNLSGNGTNTIGFNALPGGYRYFADGVTYGLGTIGYFWTSTENTALIAWYRRLESGETRVYKGAVEKQAGKSARCVKD